MKILYVIDQNIEEGMTSGIIHKIKNKIDVWRSRGVEVNILSLYSFKLYNSEIKLISDEYSFKIKKHGRYYTLLRMLKSTYLLNNFLKTNKYDLMYIRQRPYMPFTQRCFKLVKTVIEINTYDVGEYKTISKIMYIINNLTRDRFYRYAYGFVGVTKELTERFVNQYHLPAITIANGIEFESYPTKLSGTNDINIVFVGSPGYNWHGIDKVIYLAKNCPDFNFHMVGMDGENTDNLTFHGYCSLDQTKEIVKKCDVGLCSLSLHVKDMEEASPLKSRQYLAQGLPIIYAYEDTDMSGEEDFALKISNTPDNVEKNLSQIKEFINNVAKNTELSKKARSFAENILSSSKKEDIRLSFLKELKSHKRILYILDQNIEEGKTAGIIHKINAQVKYWKEHGFYVQLLTLYSFTLYNSEFKKIDDKYSFEINSHNKYITLLRLVLSTIKLFFHLRKFNYDLVYLRARPYVPFTRWIFRNSKIIIELNANDVGEWKLVNKPMYFYNLLTRHWFYTIADKFIAVGNELKQLYKEFGKEIKVIGNSIDVFEVDFVESTNNDRAQVVFVGSPGFKWNGIDKIEWMAKKMPEFDFHIVGEDGESTENLTYHGFIPLEDVRKILNNSDVAIATLSMYKKGLGSVSTIKTTQYLAQGLPIFYGYHEDGFDSTADYLLELPNTPENVEENIEEIKSFIMKCHNNTELRKAARKFAEENLDIRIKESERIDYINTLF